jgi:non-specific serine/threonine protein kinase
LAALIDWSYDLLSDPERVLLHRLSVFAGGCSLDAAQAVCDSSLPEGTLEAIGHLVDKSMVVVDEPTETSEGRYGLLETVRQYALDKLLASGESKQVRDRHSEYFLRFAEEIEPKLRSAEQLAWLSRVNAEHDNLRTALAWLLESGRSESALRLAGALSYFWELRGYWTEARKWLEAAHSSSEGEQNLVPRDPSVAAADVYKAARAKVLYASARFHFAMQLEPSGSRAIAEEALQSWRELGDKWWMAVSLEHVGWMLRWEGHVELATAPLEEGVSLAREVQDRWPLALCLTRLAVHVFGTDMAASLRLYEEAEATARTVGDKNILSQVLDLHAISHFLAGNLSAAAPLAAEALAEGRAIGSVTTEGPALLAMAVITCVRGDLVGAKALGLELLDLGHEAGSSYVQSLSLFAFGFVACFSEHPERGVLLLAAFQANAGQRGVTRLMGPILMMYRHALERARATLRPSEVAAATERGQALTLDQALELATEG